MIPSSRPNSLIYIPYPGVNCLKTIPFTAAYTYIAHIWQYPPPPVLITPKIYGSCCIRLHTTSQHSGERLLGVFFWLSYSRSREIWIRHAYGCKCKVVVLRLACEQAFGRGRKPNGFLTFLLPSPSSLCKLPNTHPSRICKSGEASFQCKPLGQCVQ